MTHTLASARRAVRWRETATRFDLASAATAKIRRARERELVQHGRVLITSGPSRARLDSVRFIMNTSTGVLGRHIAEEGMNRGWSVDFVAGPFSAIPVAPKDDTERLVVHSTPWQEDILPALERIAARRDTVAVFHAMAVLDYIPDAPQHDKRASGRPWSVRFVPTPKVIDRMPGLFPGALLVAFKLEIGVEEEVLQERATRLARRTGAELVVANLLDWVRAGEYRCLIIDKTGSVKERLFGRVETASYLWDYLEEVNQHDVHR